MKTGGGSSSSSFFFANRRNIVATSTAAAVLVHFVFLEKRKIAFGISLPSIDDDVIAASAEGNVTLFRRRVGRQRVASTIVPTGDDIINVVVVIPDDARFDDDIASARIES